MAQSPFSSAFSSSPILDQNVWSQVIVPTARELGLRLIIGSGWSRIDVDESADCKVVETVSFEEIFPRVRCAVHAGGVGTLSEAIWSGTPSVLIPVFGEQKSIAAQAFKLGLCPRPVLLKHLNRENFTGLLKAALNDARIGEATSSASDSMRGEEGLGNAVGTIESYASRALGGQQLSNE